MFKKRNYYNEEHFAFIISPIDVNGDGELFRIGVKRTYIDKIHFTEKIKLLERMDKDNKENL